MIVVNELRKQFSVRGNTLVAVNGVSFAVGNS
jgi:ABC-type oligopeptide transport system ATPase subunit